jgi:hypothetical protein
MKKWINKRKEVGNGIVNEFGNLDHEWNPKIYLIWPNFLVTFHPMLGFPKVLHILHKLAPEEVCLYEAEKVVMLFSSNF